MTVSDLVSYLKLKRLFMKNESSWILVSQAGMNHAYQYVCTFAQLCNLQDKAHINAWRLFYLLCSTILALKMKVTIVILLTFFSSSFALKCKQCDSSSSTANIPSCTNPKEITCPGSTNVYSCYTIWKGKAYYKIQFEDF